jgi:hypothetical protein
MQLLDDHEAVVAFGLSRLIQLGDVVEDVEQRGDRPTE